MQKGISVWLDVPLEALARRIVAVGTGSRPLLHCESGDAYTKVHITCYIGRINIFFIIITGDNKVTSLLLKGTVFILSFKRDMKLTFCD